MPEPIHDIILIPGFFGFANVGPHRDSPHVDWLPSASAFPTGGFEAVGSAVADEIAAAAGADIDP